MIYQQDNEFRVFKFKALVEDVVHFLDDKELFETQLLQSIKYRMYTDGSYSEEEVDNVIFPTITYSDFFLSAEQQARFDEITVYSTATLDDVSDYVFNGLTKNMELNLNREIKSLKNKNTSLEVENTLLKNDMANILMYIASM